MPCKTVSVSSLLLDVNAMQIVPVVSLNGAPTFIRSLYQWNLHFPLVPGLSTTPLYTSLLTPHLLLSDILAFLAQLSFRPSEASFWSPIVPLPCQVQSIKSVCVRLFQQIERQSNKYNNNFQVPQAQSPTRPIKALFTLDKLRVLSNESFHRLQASCICANAWHLSFHLESFHN